MKKDFFTKKRLLFILIIFLLLFFLFNYFKTTDLNFISAVNNNEKNTKIVNQLFEKDNILDSEIKKEDESIEIDQKNSDQAKEIKKVILLKEIRDPFAAVKSESLSKEKKLVKSNKNKFKINTDLKSAEGAVCLEKNIITKIKNQKPDIESNLNKKKSDSIKTEEKELNLNIKFPFKLLGIIKNNNKSSALFLYQGKNILKRETEKIDIFNIEKINKKDLVLKYENQKIKLKLWRLDEIEN